MRCLLNVDIAMKTLDLNQQLNIQKKVLITGATGAIGRHLLLDEYRKQQRWLYEVNDDLAAEDSSPEQVLEQQQKELQLQQLLLLLPLLQREALLLQLEGFSLQQIAQITVTEPETVKSRLRYARQALAKQLGGHDE